MDELITMSDYAWARLLKRLEGMSDEEYLWEPVPGCWTVRTVDGRLWCDWEPNPDPAPFTTIAWRVCHLGGACLDGFARRFFGGEEWDPNKVDWPGTSADGIAYLERTYGKWREGFGALTEDQLWSKLGPKAGPWAESSYVALVLHITDELIHHGAEIGTLRDLYRAREVRA